MESWNYLLETMNPETMINTNEYGTITVQELIQRNPEYITTDTIHPTHNLVLDKERIVLFRDASLLRGYTYKVGQYFDGINKESLFNDYAQKVYNDYCIANGYTNNINMDLAQVKEAYINNSSSQADNPIDIDLTIDLDNL